MGLQTMANKPEPFGYFRCTIEGWEDCAPTAEGARPLYEAPVDVPLLTAEELGDIFSCFRTAQREVKLARMVESAVRKKAGLL